MKLWAAVQRATEDLVHQTGGPHGLTCCGLDPVRVNHSRPHLTTCIKCLEEEAKRFSDAPDRKDVLKVIQKQIEKLKGTGSL